VPLLLCATVEESAPSTWPSDGERTREVQRHGGDVGEEKRQAAEQARRGGRIGFTGDGAGAGQRAGRRRPAAVPARRADASARICWELRWRKRIRVGSPSHLCIFFQRDFNRVGPVIRHSQVNPTEHHSRATIGAYNPGSLELF
jgi:hypothetical protein